MVQQRQKPPDQVAQDNGNVVILPDQGRQLSVESDPENEAVLRAQSRFLQKYLAEYQFRIGKDGSLWSTRGKEAVKLLVGKVAVDQVEFVRDLPRRHTDAASSTIFDRILTATFTNTAGATQTVRISYDDMESRDPDWLRQLQVLPAPHKRKRDDLHYALNVLSLAPGVAGKDVYNSSGILYRQDEPPVYLNPAAGAVTTNGLDDRYLVSWSRRHTAALESVPYGFAGFSQDEQQRLDDYFSLLRFCDLSPGCPGYGEALLGTVCFTPLSQLCPSGAAHLIIYGLTGSFKSASARLVLQCFANVWGREEITTVSMREMQSTIFGVEQIFYYLCGMPALADDALKGNSATEQDRIKFFKMISALGGHAASKKGGQRGKWSEGKGGLGHDYYPRCSMMFTVEHLPRAEDQASDLARYAIVMLNGPGSIDEQELTIMQQRDYAAAMNRATAGYIQWMLPRIDEILADMEQREIDYQDIGLHIRLPQTYAKLEAGIAAYLRYGLEIGALDQDLAQAYMDTAHDNLIALAQAQSGTMGIKQGKATTNDGISTFYSCLRDGLADHKVVLSDSERRRIPTGSETFHFHFLPQPPRCLAETGYNLAHIGWTYNEQQAVYQISGTGLEIGVLREEGLLPGAAATWVAMIPCGIWDQAWQRLEKVAAARNVPLPGSHDLRKMLKEAKRLVTTNSTNLWGRTENGGLKGKCYRLDLGPIIDPDDDPDDDAPDRDPDPGPGEDPPFSELTDEDLLPRIPLCYVTRIIPLTQSTTTPETGQIVASLKEKEETPAMIPGEEPSAPAPIPIEKKKWEGGFKMHYKTVPTAYIDVRSGAGIFDDQALTAGQKPTLSQILDAIPPDCRRVYLIGPRPGTGTAESLYQWFRDRRIAERWSVEKFHRDDDLPLLDVQEREGGRKVRVQRMAQWFGDEIKYGPKAAQAAMHLLDTLLQRHFDKDAKCLATPGSTGLALWDRTRTATYPCLDEDLQRLIRGTSGQGRFELFVQPDRPTLPGFAYSDGRFMYAGLGTGLGFGPGVRQSAGEFDTNTFDSYQRARYNVSFTVPRDWTHVGLLPTKDEEDGEGWLYPSEPGFEATTWADAVEVLLAQRYGWNVQIKERILFQSASAGHPWPLDTWIKKLVDARADIERRRESGEIHPLLAELVLAAFRNMLLHAIGGFHRRDTTETVIVHSREELALVPARYHVTAHSDGSWTYVRPVPLDRWSQQFQHPEFSAAIWARCRTHLLLSETKKKGQVIDQTGVLTLPYEDVVGLRVDAMYLTKNPGWHDDGRPGRFRLKGLIEAPCPQPETYEDLNELRDRSVEAYRKAGKA
ncbi:MAG: hypothetical protein H0U76_25835 [Ktedonobacteraceae bacterium]|nr:hypothetical protein [Ktedonobacteraceae bacterium]